MNIYKKLSNGGGYSLPYLLHIYTNTVNYYLVNDSKDITYNGQVYKAASFDYSPNQQGEADLEIDLTENTQLINILEGNENFKIDVTGVILDEAITPIEYLKHQHCRASWNETRAKIKLNADDRLNMTFPALVFNAYNNRGNA